MTRVAVNGIELNVEESGDGPALVLLHGFTGDMTTWDPFLNQWPKYTKVCFDIIGHGKSDSPADPTRYTMDHAVNDILDVLDEMQIGSFLLGGYSMGGRLAYHIAMTEPERVWAMFIESASLGIEDEAERAARLRSDNALADEIERGGLEAFVDKWQAQPLFASQSKLAPEVWERQRAQRLGASPAGLANSLRGMGTGNQEYLGPYTSVLGMPVLLLAGALDEKYSGEMRRLAWTLPTSVLQVVPGAGHAVHLERPDIFAGYVGRFLDVCQPPPPE
jgi:2-succinyl-6-hydroxy-2,4-cyclohexadiene-1-carboxylate synthase